MATYTLRTKVDLSFLDHSRESSRTQWYAPALLADGSNRAAVLTAIQNMHGGIAAVTLCNLGGGSASLYEIIELPSTPSDPNAQREIKLWVQYVDDTTGMYYSMSIPGPDLSLLAQINTDEVDIVSNVTAAAFVAIIEANAKSVFGNSITVTRMRIVRGAR